jgi:hypothetical protein
LLKRLSLDATKQSEGKTLGHYKQTEGMLSFPPKSTGFFFPENILLVVELVTKLQAFEGCWGSPPWKNIVNTIYAPPSLTQKKHYHTNKTKLSQI